MAIETVPQPSIPITTPFRPGLGFLTATPIIAAATICLALVIASAILAPWLSPHDPLLLAPAQRLKPASAQFLLGTDGYGRDVLSRVLYGGRISLLTGLVAAFLSLSLASSSLYHLKLFDDQRFWFSLVQRTWPEMA
jgi:peptide/nickel transport system permease protein